jgi:hypothetical protein
MKYANCWGVWCLDTHTAELVLILGDEEWGDAELYRIDLERCLTCGQVLDWIQHMTTKVWSRDARVITDLVMALNDILALPAHYCGNGQTNDGRTAEQVRKLCGEFKAGARWPRLRRDTP